MCKEELISGLKCLISCYFDILCPSMYEVNKLSAMSQTQMTVQDKALKKQIMCMPIF